MATTAQDVCYRHPGRETRVACSSCGRPICPDCMTPSPVGMRCPECSRQTTQVRRLPATSAVGAEAIPVTIALIVVNVILFLASGRMSFGGGGGDALFRELALWGPAVEQGDWWRLVTGGFLHGGFLHIAFNMYLLWILGRELEPVMGSVRFAVVYLTALLGGSFGALLLEPLAVTVGASGAVFGLMGATLVEIHRRGFDPLRSGIMALIGLNLVLSFVLPNISIGGHVGGLLAGLAAGLLFRVADERRVPLLGYVGCGLLSAGCVAASFAVI
ncbi:MAG: rhomboid family intramembrane serine protease [Solirubrobacteraceae bacterium]|nr:rhomboid family intramembrane serine protease [Solirubrobacteraceae bacterium]